MDKKFTWTVDCEFDFGGRTNGDIGIRYGLPLILQEFKRYNIKGLFFISTELFRDYKNDIKKIKEDGHTLGSHGHFHIIYKDKYRWLQDKEISESLLSVITGQSYHQYRAPKFNKILSNHIYSNPINHVGLLKKLWFKTSIPSNPIFYLHPFDLVSSANSPNLFCRIWYSRHKEASKLFKMLLEKYK